MDPFLVSSLPRTAGSRVFAISTAPHPDHALAGLVEQARRDPLWSLSWWTAADGLCPAPWQSPAEIASVRVSLSEGAYRRLYMNEMVAGADEALCTEDIERIFRPDGRPLEPRSFARYAGGLDLSVSGDQAGWSVAHLERARDGSQAVVVDKAVTWSPTRTEHLSQETVRRQILGDADEYRPLQFTADRSRGSA